MGTRTDSKRIRLPAPREDDTDARVELVFEEEDDAPCSEFVVMSQEPELPALEEYLRENGSRTIH